MVYKIIDDLLTDLAGKPNIDEYTKLMVKNGDFDVVYDRLNGIHNIAQKKAALYLRDIVSFWELEDELSWQKYRYVFPVDTQVRQVVTQIGIVDEGVSRGHLLESVIAKCCPDISPIAFNQGAWYIGANAFDVLIDNLQKIHPENTY